MQESNSLCTVILPVYNSELFISKTIDSIINQDFKDFKLLIIDDKSTDATNSIILKYKEKYSDIINIITHNFNKGVSSSLRTGFKNSNSKYYALIGHDDTWSPNFLSTQINFLEQNKDCFVCFSKVKFIDMHDKPTYINLFRHKFLESKRSLTQLGLTCELLKGNFLCASSSTFRNPKNILSNWKDLTVIDNDSLQDFEFWLHLSIRSKFLYNKKAITYYRIHSNNLSLSQNNLNTTRVDYTNVIDRFLNSKNFLEYILNSSSPSLNLDNILSSIFYRINSAENLKYVLINTLQKISSDSDFCHISSIHKWLATTYFINKQYQKAYRLAVNHDISLPKSTVVISNTNISKELKSKTGNFKFLNFKTYNEASLEEIKNSVFIIESENLINSINKAETLKAISEGRACVFCKKNESNILLSPPLKIYTLPEKMNKSLYFRIEQSLIILTERLHNLKKNSSPETSLSQQLKIQMVNLPNLSSKNYQIKFIELCVDDIKIENKSNIHTLSVKRNNSFICEALISSKEAISNLSIKLQLNENLNTKIRTLIINNKIYQLFETNYNDESSPIFFAKFITEHTSLYENCMEYIEASKKKEDIFKPIFEKLYSFILYLKKKTNSILKSYPNIYKLASFLYRYIKKTN